MARINIDLDLNVFGWIDDDGNLSIIVADDEADSPDHPVSVVFKFEDLIMEYAGYTEYDYENLLALRNVFDNAASYIDRLVSKVESDNLGAED